MNFSTLSQYFEKLEGTSKRLELVDILAKSSGEIKVSGHGRI